MTVKLLTEHHWEFLSLKGGCTGSSESYNCQNATLLEMLCHNSYIIYKVFSQYVYPLVTSLCQVLAVLLDSFQSNSNILSYHVLFIGELELTLVSNI